MLFSSVADAGICIASWYSLAMSIICLGGQCIVEAKDCITAWVRESSGAYPLWMSWNQELGLLLSRLNPIWMLQWWIPFKRRRQGAARQRPTSSLPLTKTPSSGPTCSLSELTSPMICWRIRGKSLFLDVSVLSCAWVELPQNPRGACPPTILAMTDCRSFLVSAATALFVIWFSLAWKSWKKRLTHSGTSLWAAPDCLLEWLRS